MAVGSDDCLALGNDLAEHLVRHCCRCIALVPAAELRVRQVFAHHGLNGLKELDRVRKSVGQQRDGHTIGLQVDRVLVRLDRCGTHTSWIMERNAHDNPLLCIASHATADPDYILSRWLFPARCHRTK